MLNSRIPKNARIRSYSILLLGAGLAGLVGLAFDQITVTISPEYFTIGKGLRGDALRLEVAWLGFRSALPIGALVAGIGLVYGAKRPRFSWCAWLAPIGLTLLVSLPVAALAMVRLDPFDVQRLSQPTAASLLSCRARPGSEI